MGYVMRKRYPLVAQILILSTLLVTLQGKDIPDFIAQAFRKPPKAVDVKNPAGQNIADKNPAGKNIAGKIPAEQIEMKNPAGQNIAGKNPTEQVAVKNPAEQVEVKNPAGQNEPASQKPILGIYPNKHSWVMGQTLPQLLEDSVENKYREVFQRNRYVPRALRSTLEPKRSRRNIGVRQKRIDNTLEQRPHIRRNRVRRDVPDDIHGIDDFINGDNVKEKVDRRNAEMTNDDQPATTPRYEHVEGETIQEDRRQTEEKKVTVNKYNDEYIYDDDGEGKGDPEYDKLVHEIRIAQGDPNVSTTTINYLDQVTFKQVPPLSKILGKDVYERLHPSKGTPTTEPVTEFVVPPKMSTAKQAYPYKAAEVYNEFNNILGWIQTKTQVRQQVENREAKTEPTRPDDGLAIPYDETTVDYLDIVNKRINENARVARKWNEEVVRQKLEKERAMEALGFVSEEKEEYTHRTRPAVSDLSGYDEENKEDDEEQGGFRRYYPPEEIPTPECPPEEEENKEEKININSVKYRFMQLRKKYKEMSEEKKIDEIKERIARLKESYHERYRALSRKTLQEVESYGPDRTEEFANFPKEWYAKNKHKVRTIKEIEEEHEREEEENARRAARYTTRKPLLRTIKQQPEDVPKSRKRRATKVLYRKNNQTFVISYKHLDKMRRKNMRIYLNHEHIRKFDRMERKKRHVLNIMMMGKRRRASRFDPNEIDRDENELNEVGKDVDSEPEGINENIVQAEKVGDQDDEDNRNEDQPIYLADSDLTIRDANEPEDKNLIELKPGDIVDQYEVDSNYGDPNDIVPEKEAEENDLDAKGDQQYVDATIVDNMGDEGTAEIQPDKLDENTDNTVTESTPATATVTGTVSEGQSEVERAKEAKELVVMANENPLPILVRKKRGDAPFIYVTKPKGGWKKHIKKQIARMKKLESTKFKDRIYEWTTKHKWETLPDEIDRTTPTLAKRRFLDLKRLRLYV